MKYLYLTSWLRAREKRIVDGIDVDRMIGADNVDDCFKILNDTDYAPFLSGRTYLNIEEIIEDERKNFEKELIQAGVEESLVEALFFKDRAFKILYKAKKEKNKELLQEFFVQKKDKDWSEIERGIFEIVFVKIANVLNEEKEKGLMSFFKEYEEKIRSAIDPKERDGVLCEMEEDILKKEKEEVDGLFPLFAFLIKKRRAQQWIRKIFWGKKMGIGSDKLYNLIKAERVL